MLGHGEIRAGLTFFSSSGFLIKAAELYLKDLLDHSCKYALLSGTKTSFWKASEFNATGIKTPTRGQMPTYNTVYRKWNSKFQVITFLPFTMEKFIWHKPWMTRNPVVLWRLIVHRKYKLLLKNIEGVSYFLFILKWKLQEHGNAPPLLEEIPSLLSISILLRNVLLLPFVEHDDLLF